jgi:branched-chain amino acid transport system permease protein
MGGVILKPIDLVIVAVAIVFTVGVSAYLKYSRNGRAMRALAEDQDAARLMGIPVARLVITCFLIGSLLAGVAGVLIGQKYGHITPFLGFLPGLKAFVAAVIGGIGSFYGAILGGLILGVLEVLLVGYLPDALGQFRDAYVFLVLILVLLVRPSGLLGLPEATKV